MVPAKMSPKNAKLAEAEVSKPSTARVTKRQPRKQPLKKQPVARGVRKQANTANLDILHSSSHPTPYAHLANSQDFEDIVVAMLSIQRPLMVAPVPNPHGLNPVSLIPCNPEPFNQYHGNPLVLQAPSTQPPPQQTNATLPPAESPPALQALFSSSAFWLPIAIPGPTGITNLDHTQEFSRYIKLFWETRQGPRLAELLQHLDESCSDEAYQAWRKGLGLPMAASDSEHQPGPSPGSDSGYESGPGSVSGGYSPGPDAGEVFYCVLEKRPDGGVDHVWRLFKHLPAIRITPQMREAAAAEGGVVPQVISPSPSVNVGSGIGNFEAELMRKIQTLKEAGAGFDKFGELYVEQFKVIKSTGGGLLELRMLYTRMVPALREAGGGTVEEELLHTFTHFELEEAGVEGPDVVMEELQRLIPGHGVSPVSGEKVASGSGLGASETSLPEVSQDPVITVALVQGDVNCVCRISSHIGQAWCGPHEKFSEVPGSAELEPESLPSGTESPAGLFKDHPMEDSKPIDQNSGMEQGQAGCLCGPYEISLEDPGAAASGSPVEPLEDHLMEDTALINTNSEAEKTEISGPQEVLAAEGGDQVTLDWEVSSLVDAGQSVAGSQMVLDWELPPPVDAGQQALSEGGNQIALDWEVPPSGDGGQCTFVGGGDQTILDWDLSPPGDAGKHATVESGDQTILDLESSPSGQYITTDDEDQTAQDCDFSSLGDAGPQEAAGGVRTEIDWVSAVEDWEWSGQQQVHQGLQSFCDDTASGGGQEFLSISDAGQYAILESGHQAFQDCGYPSICVSGQDAAADGDQQTSLPLHWDSGEYTDEIGPILEIPGLSWTFPQYPPGGDQSMGGNVPSYHTVFPDGLFDLPPMGGVEIGGGTGVFGEFESLFQLTVS